MKAGHDTRALARDVVKFIAGRKRVCIFLTVSRVPRALSNRVTSELHALRTAEPRLEYQRGIHLRSVRWS